MSPAALRRSAHLPIRHLVVAVALVAAVTGPLAAPARGATCSVPGDYATIALALAEPTCTTIVLAAGAYTGPVAIDHSVIIQGPNVGVPGTGTRGAEAAITSATDGITISDGTVTIDGVQVTATGTAIATTAEADALTIANNVLDGAVGVSVDASGQITVDDNLVTADGGLGINLVDPGTSSGISGNTIDGVTGTTAEVAGIQVSGAGGPVTISGNDVSDVVGSPAAGSGDTYGIRVDGSAGIVTVSGNTVDGTAAGTGVTFTGASGIDIFAAGVAINVTGNTVTDTDCPFDGCDALGINAFSTGAAPIEVIGNSVMRTTAEGTTSINDATGISIFAIGASVHAADNTVTTTHAASNSIAGATGLSGNSDASSVLLENNTVSDTVATSAAGIASSEGIIGGRDGIGGVTVTGNTVSDTTGVGPTGSGRAVTAYAFEGSATATNNIVTDVDGVGVSVFSAVSGTASGNSVSGLGETGILLGGGTGSSLASANVVTGGDVGIQVQGGYEAPGTLAASNNLVTGAGTALSFNTWDFDVPVFAGTVTATSNTLLESDTGILIQPFVELDPAATFQLRFNRIVGNADGLDHQGTGDIDAINNWWGCNEGPGASGCDDVVIATPASASVDSDPWLILGLVAGPGANQATAELTQNSAAADTQGAGFVRNGTPVAFTSTFGTLNPAAGGTLSGELTTQISSPTAGSSTVCATVDNEEVCRTITVTVATPPPPSPSASPSAGMLPDTGVGAGTIPGAGVVALWAVVTAASAALYLVQQRRRRSRPAR